MSERPRPDPDGDADARLSDAEAAAVWQRAAQLHADAVHRLEAGGLAPAAGDGGAAPESAPGYSLAQVRAAAAEAGIPASYVSLALAELREAPAAAGAWQVRHAPRVLGRTPPYLSATRVVDAPPAEALAAAGRVLLGAPYLLEYAETQGPPPLEGGVVVLRLPGPVITLGTERMPAQDAWYTLRGVLEAETVRLTVRPAPGDPRRTELTLHADLRPGVRRNVNMGLAMAGLAAIPAGLAGVGAAAALGLGAAVGAPVAAALAAVAALPAGLFAGARGYGATYRWYARRAEGELGAALAAVAASFRAAAVFGAGPPFGAPGGPR